MHVYYLYICTDARIWTFFFWMPFASWSEEFSSPVLLFILLNRHANEWQVFFSFDLKFQMKFEFCSSHQILLDLHWAWLCLVLFLEQKRKNINNIRLVGETWTCNFKCRSFCLQFKFFWYCDWELLLHKDGIRYFFHYYLKLLVRYPIKFPMFNFVHALLNIRDF